MAGEEKTRRCVVLGGGPIEEEEIALIRPEDTIWAADAGLRAARRFGLHPALCLGDWDSCERPQRAEELICLPSEKDDTDTHYAARLLVQRGFREALLLGGIGGRLDHTLANLCSLLFLVRSGVSCWLVGQGAAVTVLQNGTMRLPRRENTYFSIFAADGSAQGISLAGTKYPLQEAELTAGFPLGVSNEILADWADVTVREGALYLMYSKKK